MSFRHRSLKAAMVVVLLMCAITTPAQVVVAEDRVSVASTDSPVPESASTTTGAETDDEFQSETEKLSYALGMNVGLTYLRESLDIDPALFSAGLHDAFSGENTRLTETELRALMNEFQNEMKRRRQARQAAAERKAAESQREAGTAFLAKNAGEPGVISLESGLQYRVLEAGKGPQPTANDLVVCHYRGTFVDGTEFDSSYKRNKPATFHASQVIKGWTEALQRMRLGAKWQLFIPSHLAYGTNGRRPTIPPNATLVFEIELLDISRTSNVDSDKPSDSASL